MKPQKKNETKVSIAPEDVIICKHCGEFMFNTRIIGLSLVCPACNKPQNGRLRLEIADFQ